MKNHLRKFKFRMSLDGGSTLISVPARSYHSAYRNLRKAEQYPVNAIEYLNRGS